MWPNQPPEAIAVIAEVGIHAASQNQHFAANQAQTKKSPCKPVEQIG